MSKIEKFQETLEEFENLRSTYRNVVNKNEAKRDTFLEFQSRFTDLKADLRPIHALVTRHYTSRDEKASTAIKFRLAIAIQNGEHEDFDSCSINQAEKYASGCKEYKEFINQRSFWKESLVNINDVLDDIQSYLIEISTRLKYLQ